MYNSLHRLEDGCLIEAGPEPCTNPKEQERFGSGLFELPELGTHLHFLVYNKHLAAQESDDLSYDCYI